MRGPDPYDLAELRKDAYRFRAKIGALSETESLVEGTLARLVVSDQHHLPDVPVPCLHLLEQSSTGT